MTKITEQTFPSNDQTNVSESWWHRPITAVQEIITSFVGGSAKPEIPEAVMILHQRDMMDLRVFAKTAEAIDDEKFCNEEFLQYARLKYSIARGLNGYEGLEHSIELLQVAIEAKDSFIAIDQTELRYRAMSQQELYKCVEEQLIEVKNKQTFHKIVFDKLEEVLPKVKTEEGKEALEKYSKHLERLSEHQLGLKLLSLFKTYELADYSVLQVISQILQKLRKQDTLNEAHLLRIVKANYLIFEKLRKIIGLSPAQSSPETYTKILHYIALSHRHALSYNQFDELLTVLRQWVKPYRVVERIRNDHPRNQYKRPKIFSEPIPGVEIYQKYQKSLTDEKTGMTYINFDN
ncbi:MAG: hypothetical protein AB4041_04475 [Microcystaceae cyanobacterium]